MTSAIETEADWEKLGGPLEDLMRYERKIGHYEHASYDLLSSVTHEPNNSTWPRFLLRGENLALVVDQVLSLSRSDSVDPKRALDAIRRVVEGAQTSDPEGGPGLIDLYVRQRQRIPGKVRPKLDQLIMAGKSGGPLCAVALAMEIERAQSKGALSSAAGEVLEHWFEMAVEGRLSEGEARAIPGKIIAARDRILSELGQIRKGPEVDEDSVYSLLAFVFKSNEIESMADLVIAVYGSGLTIDIKQIEAFLTSFLEHHSVEETVRRMERLGQWMTQFVGRNNEGVIFTPLVTSYLAGQADLEDGLAEFDRLREETLAGRFRIDNELQKDLEFQRFAGMYTWLNGGIRGSEEQYALFKELPVLPPPKEEQVQLNDQHLAQARRSGFEAACFLRFLRRFKSKTSRPIVVVGNDRYGRQWVVEPLREFLKGDFTLRDARVRSHASFRLRVPHEVERMVREGFSQEFVRELSEHTPHVVIVDARNPLRGPGMMKYARGARDYVNWFAVFNDIRAEGDMSKYEHESSIPHLAELRKWYEFDIVRRQIKEWVKPGPTYKITHWAPEMREYALLGDFVVPAQEPDPIEDKPLVVLANADIFDTKYDGLGALLTNTRPYYFDGPEKYVQEEIVFGFGEYGIETRVKGPTTDQFVAAVQKRIAAEVTRFLESGSVPEDGVIDRPK